MSGLGESLGKTAGVAGTFAAGIGTVVVAAAAVAGLSLNQYINTLSKLSVEQARTNVLLEAMDFGGLTGRAKTLDTQIRELQATFSIWGGVKNITVSAMNEIGAALDKLAGGQASGLVRRFGTDQAGIDIARQALAGANADILKLLPREQERSRTEFDLLRAKTSGEIAGLRAQQAVSGPDQPDIGTFLAEMGLKKDALSKELDLREELIKKEGEARVSAAQSRQAGAEELAFIGEDIRLKREALGVTAAFDALREARTQGAVAIGQRLSAGEEDLSKVALIKGTEADVELAERRRTAELGLLDITRQRAELTGQLTPELEAQLILRERELSLEQAGLTVDEQRIITARSQLQLLQLQQKSEVGPGLLRGLSDVEQNFGAVGLRMQTWAQSTAGGMARAFDDGFFDVLTGNFKDLPSVGQRFAADMVRAMTAELAKFATSAIFGQIRGLFGGDTAGSLPFGAGSGGGPALSFSSGSPLLTTAGRPLSQSEINTAFEAGGEQGVRALQSGQATVVGGEFVVAGAGLEQAGAGAGLVTTSSGFTFSSPTFRQGLGIAGSAALLGLTAYGATGAQSTADVITGAVAGALAGATLGSQVGGLAGYGGTGAAVGAVAGAAIAGTIALLSKQAADKQAAKERQAAEVARAAGAGSDLVRSAGSATSLADLFRRITAAGSGYTGGTANPAVSTTVQTPTGPRPIGIENQYYPVATLQDLLANPESLQANIQAGVDPSQLAGPNAATSTALQGIARDLVNQFRSAEQGVGITQEDMTGGGLTRRTTYPASRSAMLDPNREVEIDELALAELSEEDRALLQLELMSRVAVDTDFVSTISDGATGQIVSITRIARSTIALPGTGAVIPPAGVTQEQAAAIAAASQLNLAPFTEAAPTGGAIYGDIQTGSGEGGPTFMTVQTGLAPATADQLAAYVARRDAFYAAEAASLTDAQKAALAPLTTEQVGALAAQGKINQGQIVALIQAGLLPNVTQAITDTLRAIDFIASGGDPGSVPGPDTGFSPNITGYDPSLVSQGLGALAAGATLGTAIPGSLLSSLVGRAIALGPTGNLVDSNGNPVAFLGQTSSFFPDLLANLYNGLLGVLGVGAASPSFVGSVGVAPGVNADLGTEFAGLAPTNSPIGLAGLNGLLGLSSPNVGLYSGFGGLPSTYSGYAFGAGTGNPSPNSTDFGQQSPTIEVTEGDTSGGGGAGSK